jgi:hypothetical protein
MINIAVRTAGRGAKDDYIWKFLSQSDPDLHKDIAKLTDERWSCAITRDNAGFNFFIGGIETSHTDYTNIRFIKTSVSYRGLNELQARQMLVLALQDPNCIAQKVIEAFLWGTPGDEGGWRVDFEKLIGVLDFAADREILRPGSPQIGDAWERPNTAENRRKLADQISQFSFSQGYGVKVVVSDAPQQFSQLLEEADHLLWEDAPERNLNNLRPKKKPEPSSHIQSEKSKLPSSQHSDETSPSPSCQDSSNDCWISSNKGLLMICGVVVIGILLAGTCKKKVIEPTDVKPATEQPQPVKKQPPGSADPSSGITPKTSPQPEDLPATKAPDGGQSVEAPAQETEKP